MTRMFLYIVLAAATVISRLITYSDKMDQIMVIESLELDLKRWSIPVSRCDPNYGVLDETVIC